MKFIIAIVSITAKPRGSNWKKKRGLLCSQQTQGNRQLSMPNIKTLTKSGMKRTSSKLNCRLTADERNSPPTGLHSPLDRPWPLLSSWNVTHHQNTSLLQQSLAGSMSSEKSMAGKSKITYQGECCTLHTLAEGLQSIWVLQLESQTPLEFTNNKVSK